MRKHVAQLATSWMISQTALARPFQFALMVDLVGRNQALCRLGGKNFSEATQKKPAGLEKGSFPLVILVGVASQAFPEA